MNELLSNQWFTTAIVGIITALLGYFSKRVEKAPDIQESLNSAVAGITKYYLEALTSSTDQIIGMRGEIVAMQHTVKAQSALIVELESHINDLVQALSKAGVTPPPRQRRTKQKE